MFKSTITLLIFISSFLSNLRADEGLWLPFNISDKVSMMQAKGLKLSAEDLYSINKVCLKDAIIGLTSNNQFDSFCTGSFVSKEGLILTNYHCILSHIEKLSTPENDFLKYGFWTTERKQETKLFGLQAIRLVKMVDVTDEVLDGITPADRLNITPYLNSKGKKIVERETAGTNNEGLVSAFYANNQFILSIYERYSDIRLAAAPPLQIGKFGNENDNWQWPRYAGDFAFLRVYDSANVPLQSPNYLSVSLKEVKDDDFLMIFGYPNQTRFHVPSFALDEIVNGELSIRAHLRKEKLDLITDLLKRDESRKLRYITRQGSLQNTYLRTKGEIDGITNMGLVEKKLKDEKNFINWASQSADRHKYIAALDSLRNIYEQLKVYNRASVFLEETTLYGADIVPFAGKFEKLLGIFERKNRDTIAINKEVTKLIALTKGFFPNWDMETDRLTYKAMLGEYRDNMPKAFFPHEAKSALDKYNGNIDSFLKETYETSILTDETKLLSFLENINEQGTDLLKDDLLYQSSLGFYRINVSKVIPVKRKLQSKLLIYFQKYLLGQLTMNEGKLLPDANRTLRIAYGTAGMGQAGGQTYLSEMIAKWEQETPESVYYIPGKFRKLYKEKDFGKYGKNGNLVVNFISNIHTSGGNSGSPILNDKGYLVGLNFDRLADGVASDYRYDENNSKNISVNISFILFLLDKYSYSNHLLSEISIND